MISSKVEERLKEVLGTENYDYATAVVTYSEAKSLEYIYSGMAEFRDSLTHIKRAIFSEKEDKSLEELDLAFEHIRRAAVESIQLYVENKFKDISDRAYSPKRKYWLSGTKRMDLNEFRNREKKIKEYLFMAREAKPHKEWQKSIACFKKVEEELEELDGLLPTDKQLNYNISENILLIFGIILGFILCYVIK